LNSDLGDRVDWAATCENCEWSRTMTTEAEARIVALLHILTKHPLRYKLVTGKDPDEAQHAYKEMIDKYRKDL
jgi:hypothetical protein